MSIDLNVKLSTPVEVDEFLKLAQMTLKEILSLTEVPQLRITELYRGIRRPLTERNLGHLHLGYLVGIEGLEEEVSIGIIEIQQMESNVSAEEAGLFAFVSVGGVRTSLDIALAGSVAIAIAELSQNPINDDGENWTYINQQLADSFKNRIKIQGNFQDINAAAEEMCNKLPIAKSSK